MLLDRKACILPSFTTLFVALCHGIRGCSAQANQSCYRNTTPWRPKMLLSALLLTIFTTSLALPPGSIRPDEAKLAFAAELEQDPTMAGLVTNITSYGQGYLIILSDPSKLSASEDTSDLDDTTNLSPRCGTNRVSCTNFFPVRSEVCQTLEVYLHNTSDRSDDTDTGVCWSDFNRDRCCATWSRRIGRVRWQYLVNGMRDIRKRCKGWEGRVAGHTDDVNLGGRCVRQCLGAGVDCLA